MPNDLSHQILDAVAGDADALHHLAQAIAARDTAGVRSVLAGRGVHLDDAAASQVMSIAGAPDGAATFTYTCTCT